MNQILLTLFRIQTCKISFVLTNKVQLLLWRIKSSYHKKSFLLHLNTRISVLLYDNSICMDSKRYEMWIIRMNFHISILDVDVNHWCRTSLEGMEQSRKPNKELKKNNIQQINWISLKNTHKWKMRLNISIKRLVTFASSSRTYILFIILVLNIIDNFDWINSFSISRIESD